MNVPDLSQNAARNRNSTQPEEELGPVGGSTAGQAPEVIEADTAFLVYRLPNGETVVTPDLYTPVIPRRDPTTDEVSAMSANVIEKVRMMTTIPAIAEAVVMRVKHEQTAAMEAAQVAAVKQAMAKKGH